MSSRAVFSNGEALNAQQALLDVIETKPSVEFYMNTLVEEILCVGARKHDAEQRHQRAPGRLRFFELTEELSRCDHYGLHIASVDKVIYAGQLYKSRAGNLLRDVSLLRDARVPVARPTHD